MSEHTVGKDRTWRDYCKHNGPCRIVGSDRCSMPDDPAYIAAMEARYPRVIPPEVGQ